MQYEVLPPESRAIPAGTPLRQIVDEFVPSHLRHHPGLVVYSQGTLINDIDAYYVRECDRILVGLRPMGGGGGEGGNRGKSIGQIILGIVLIVVGAVVDVAAYGIDGGQLIMLGAALLLGGIAGLIIKPPSLGKQNTQQSVDSQYYGITGQSNAARPYQSCLKLYGRHRMFPVLAANPVIYNAGSVSMISAIYDFGIGNVTVTDLKIGDTPVDIIKPELRIFTNQTDIQPQLSTRRVSYQSLSYVLQYGVPLTISTAPNTLSVNIDLAFPQGLFTTVAATGAIQATFVEFDATWTDGVNTYPVTDANIVGMGAQSRAVPTGTQTVKREEVEGWVSLITRQGDDGEYYDADEYTYMGRYMGASPPDSNLNVYEPGGGVYLFTLARGRPDGTGSGWHLDKIEITDDYINTTGFILGADTPRPIVAMVQIQFPQAGQYSVTFNRLTPIATDTRTYNSATLTQIKSFTAGPMFALRHPHTMVEMRVQGSERLSGVVQNMSALATSVLPIYDAAGNFQGEAATRNPAWCALDALIGTSNPSPVPGSMIDWPSWAHLAEYCDAQRTWNIDGQVITSARHHCDVVVDYLTTVKDIVDSILACCRASLIVTQTGKYGVLIDEEKASPRQLITPTNSFAFAAVRSYPPIIHGYRVNFNDEDRNYQPQEAYVYADGYNASNATQFETLTTFALSTYHHAWAWGRYMLAQRVQRAEVFTLKMDAEHIAVQRGDLVHVAHDVPRIGGQQCRIVDVQGNTVFVNNDFATAPTNYTMRMQNGTVKQGAVVSVVDSASFVLDSAAGMHADDLIVLGLADRVIRPYLVQSIQPESDFIATLTLSVYEPSIYQADQGMLPAWNPGFSDDLINASSLAVTSVTPRSELFYSASNVPWTRVFIDFTVNSPFYAYAEIYLQPPNGALIPIATARGVLTGMMEFSMLDSPFNSYNPLVFVVQPFTAGGVPGLQGVGSLAQIVVPLPQAPQRFDLDMKRDTIGAHWDHPADARGIAGYEIRYDPHFADSSIDNATVIVRNVAFPTTAVELPTRLGSYFIKSIDTLGRRSVGYAVSFTPAEYLWNLNVIATVDDSPAWAGVAYQFDKVGAALITSQTSPGVFASRSEYYYHAFFDGGQIYQSRLTSKINVAAVYANSVMAAWVPLASADPIAGSSDSTASGGQIGDFLDVWQEVRWTNVSGAMSSWVPLASANPIGLGNATFGEWRRFYVGDFTARYFQFRIVAEYIGGKVDPDIGAIVVAAQVDIDMPDRMDAKYDIAAPVAGIHISHIPPFRDRPVVTIAIDNGQAGDTYVLTNQTRTGFDIVFKNAGASVARQFDYMAKGYGAESVAIPVGRTH